MQNNAENFIGSKAALIYEGKILTHLRGDVEGISFRNLWDLPGGKKEKNETPYECIERETYEEYGVRLNEKNIILQKIYPDLFNSGKTIYFFVFNVTKEDIENIKSSYESEVWDLIPIPDFLNKENAIKPLQEMVSDYIN